MIPVDSALSGRCSLQGRILTRALGRRQGGARVACGAPRTMRAQTGAPGHNTHKRTLGRIEAASNQSTTRKGIL
jgi:hypothetical protein